MLYVRRVGVGVGGGRQIWLNELGVITKKGPQRLSESKAQKETSQNKIFKKE